ncbi:alpha-L-rhamnosidase C-terminal domain-containing protein [Chitinophaga sp. Cy-1792]|uniref:alpha-L-rhamnosidase-related protein n=1 Tax=Chitinophaga sp. Cy-1792 TaxID=2608339 RepID=UPI0019623C2E|nr:alpha-L-rhamnosidase C-terminal domain-containing protein [Chitinophaga sp. Cy-1792]
MKRPVVLLLLLLGFTEVAIAQKARWIWYPGDFDIWLSNKVQNRRTEKGSFYPVFWKMDSHYVLVEFHKVVELKEPKQIAIHAEGTYNVKLDGNLIPGTPEKVWVPAGKHKINIKVFSQATVPSVWIAGKTICSDASWRVTIEDKEWIDETGKASDVSATTYHYAATGEFADPMQPPSAYKLPVVRKSAVATTSGLTDFGKETFGYIKLHGLRGKGKLTIYYGESKEEALSTAGAETLDQLTVDLPVKKDSVMPLSKAFRFVNIVKEGNVVLDSVSMLYEYADLPDKGSFSCSDPELNKIYDVAKYTLHLCSREFFIDGIKRDRWIWSGDAYQSDLMNYYLMNDNTTVTRTLYALRGKDPVTSHINTIMDYTFYWFMGIYDYYLYTGDEQFMRQNYERMKSLISWVLERRNKDGLLEWRPGDWIFIDWAAGLSKEGAISFEQLLFARSLETMSLCAKLVNDKDGAVYYGELATTLRKKLFDYYWSSQKNALVHSRINGQPTETVTRYANMFAIFFDYFDAAQKQAVKKSVLLNDDVQKITTPYMRFYELEALCAMGEQAYVLKEMKDYWGGMLQLGATSFWEEYKPGLTGADHYAMYGRPFGKSLCHAWGASPIYLLGKYYLGVKPLTAGYKTYLVQPELGGLQWMKGAVPTPDGNILVDVSTKQIKVHAPAGTGTLRIKSKTMPAGNDIEVISAGDNNYEITIKPARDYVINYTAL